MGATTWPPCWSGWGADLTINWKQYTAWFHTIEPHNFNCWRSPTCSSQPIGPQNSGCVSHERPQQASLPCPQLPKNWVANWRGPFSTSWCLSAQHTPAHCSRFTSHVCRHYHCTNRESHWDMQCRKEQDISPLPWVVWADQPSGLPMKSKTIAMLWHDMVDVGAELNHFNTGFYRKTKQGYVGSWNK